MQNEKNETKTHSLKVEKTIQKTPTEVYRAIGEGRLFMNCGASNETLKIDFKVGGQYRIDFLNYGMFNQGEFLELVPAQKIVFTWCQDADSNPVPDTRVTILLKAQDQGTLLTLEHTGFSDAESRDNHQGGWTNGTTDLSLEMVEGHLKLVRLFNTPVENLFKLFENSSSFLCKMGTVSPQTSSLKSGSTFEITTPQGQIMSQVSEFAAGQKITFIWSSTTPDLKNSTVTLTFDTEEDNQSWLELNHLPLPTEAQQTHYRKIWDHALNELRLTLPTK